MTGLEILMRAANATFAFILLCSSTFAEPVNEPLEPPPDILRSGKKYAVEKTTIPKKTSQQSENNEYIPKPTRKQSGFIVKDIAKSGFILKGFNPNTILGNGEIVYVKKGRLDNLKVGQKLTIFSAKRKVSKPKIVNEDILDLEMKSFDRTTDSYYMAANDLEVSLTRPFKKLLKFGEKNLGYLVKQLGTIEILEKGKSSYKAIIREAFAPIKTGDRLAHTMDQDFTTIRTKKVDFVNFEGVITAFSKVGALASRNDIIMIDKGSEDGLVTGDRLDIFVKPKKVQSKGLKFWRNNDLDMPNEIIGRIQILSTRKTTSTAIILFNKREVLLGQRVKFPKLASIKPNTTSEGKSTTVTMP